MKIAVIDGQGGGIGKSVITQLRRELGDLIEIVALGTNSYAAASMVKCGADTGASGEEAICHCCSYGKLDCIIGPIGILCPGSISGEMTSPMAESIFSCNCRKYIIPMSRHGLYIAGTQNIPLNDFIIEIVQAIKKSCRIL